MTDKDEAIKYLRNIFFPAFPEIESESIRHILYDAMGEINEVSINSIRKIKNATESEENKT